jgi:hypothetical protein
LAPRPLVAGELDGTHSTLTPLGDLTQHRARVSNIGDKELIPVLISGNGSRARVKSLTTVAPLYLTLSIEVSTLQS